MRAQKADILSQQPRRLGFARPLALAMLLLAVPALTVLTAFGIAPDTSVGRPSGTTVQEVVELPELAPGSAAPSAKFTTQERVLRGDTVAALLDRLGVRDARAMEFLRADATGRAIFRQLVP